MTEYIGATPEPVGPPKARPSAAWFVVGALLVVAAVVAGIVLFVRIFDSGFFDVEARVPADGQAHTVTVGTDGDRFLWVQEYDAADCVIQDARDGSAIPVRRIDGTFNRSSGDYADGVWVADGTFDPGSGRLSVTCDTSAGPAEIGPAVDVSGFVRALLIAIVVPLLLGGLGLAVLIGTGVLWATRSRPAPR